MQNIELDRLALVIGRLVIGQEAASQQIAALQAEMEELKKKGKKNGD